MISPTKEFRINKVLYNYFSCIFLHFKTRVYVIQFEIKYYDNENNAGEFERFGLFILFCLETYLLHINLIKMQIKIAGEAEAAGSWKSRVRYSPAKRILDREVEASGHRLSTTKSA